MLPKRPSSSGIILLIWFSLLPLPVSADGDLRARLEQLRYQSVPTVLGVPLASARLLDDFYYQRNDRFVWDRNQRVEDLLRLVEQSADEGFQPGDFHAQKIRDIAADRPSLRLFASASADEEILLSDSLLRLIHHRRYGKIDPKRLDRNWNYAGPYAHDLLEDLERAVRAQNLPAEVEGLTAQPAFYTRLQQGLVRYRRIAATGGWPRLPAGKPLRPSASDPRVPILRKRLQATGDYKGPASTSPVYDAALATAVRTFQKRHRLESKGIVGTKTRAAMNVPVTRRIDQIRINLERMRWLSDRLPDDFLLVDIVEQKAELFRNGRVIWDSRVIVGRSKRPTPMFRDQVEYLEINPGWIVPPTILKKDILPAARKNPNSLKRRGLQVITRDGKPVSPQSVNWNRSPANFPYLIRQPPGPRNALGQIKFMFPNRYAVYLHDTPNRGLFNRSRRLLSSGCVRVERPWRLAELILDDPNRWNRAQFRRIVATQRTRQVRLDEPLTIILAYWTATGDPNGKVLFRQDIYKQDATLLRALDKRSDPVRIVYREPKIEETASTAPVEEKPFEETAGWERWFDWLSQVKTQDPEKPPSGTTSRQDPLWGWEED
ncbi:MAG: L,D-transpeptidase family protein [Candidatus Thiosymbion ectosymbiont of Robbea hypermnestra]|nr:L,D-transpeptidase family protein [Candidatus Thiosymbion ectosymbiont of Robbea hypermnestra]